MTLAGMDAKSNAFKVYAQQTLTASCMDSTCSTSLMGKVVQEHLVAEFDQWDAAERVRAGGVRQEHPSLDARRQTVSFVVSARADAHHVEDHVGQQQRAEFVLPRRI